MVKSSNVDAGCFLGVGAIIRLLIHSVTSCGIVVDPAIGCAVFNDLAVNVKRGETTPSRQGQETTGTKDSLKRVGCFSSRTRQHRPPRNVASANADESVFRYQHPAITATNSVKQKSKCNSRATFSQSGMRRGEASAAAGGRHKGARAVNNAEEGAWDM